MPHWYRRWHFSCFSPFVVSHTLLKTSFTKDAQNPLSWPAWLPTWLQNASKMGSWDVLCATFLSILRDVHPIQYLLGFSYTRAREIIIFVLFFHRFFIKNSLSHGIAEKTSSQTAFFSVFLPKCIQTGTQAFPKNPFFGSRGLFFAGIFFRLFCVPYHQPWI